MNGDLIFQPGNAVWDGFKYVGGEFGALQRRHERSPIANPFDQTLRRPYREETTVGVDHELFPASASSVTYIHRRERDAQGTVDQSMDQWPNQLHADRRRPSRAATACVRQPALTDAPHRRSYNLNPDVTPIDARRPINDDRLATHYNGLELTVTKRYSDGLVAARRVHLRAHHRRN